MLHFGGLYGNMFMLWASPTDYMQSLYDHFGDVVPIGGRHPRYVFAMFGAIQKSQTKSELARHGF